MRKISITSLILLGILGTTTDSDAREKIDFTPPTAYKENYILIGKESDPVDGESDFYSIKLQLSLKKDLIDKPFGQDVPLYFGFTEVGFWDIGRESAPFREIIFRPELFLELLGKKSAEDEPDPPLKKIRLWRLPFGVLHESNGRGGDESRSWNRLYIEPNFAWSPGGQWHFAFNWNIWWAFDKSDENRDIEDFYGYNEWTLKAGFQDYQLASRFRYGKSEKGQALADLSGPFSDWGWFKFLKGYWHIQYFEGYGETLLNYNVKDRELRAGFMFYR